MREESLYGMNKRGGGSVGMSRGLFATMLERTDKRETIGLNRSRLRSTRPVETNADRGRSRAMNRNPAGRAGTWIWGAF